MVRGHHRTDIVTRAECDFGQGNTIKESPCSGLDVMSCALLSSEAVVLIPSSRRCGECRINARKQKRNSNLHEFDVVASTQSKSDSGKSCVNCCDLDHQ
jgi:hypothetical protein